MRSIKASEFKVKSLKLIDEVAVTGDSIVITRRGRPLVQMVPAPRRAKPAQRRAKSLFGLHKGQIKILGDIIEPIDVEWDSER